METSRPETFIPIFTSCFAIFFILIIMAFVAVIYCKIFAKTGYHWALGLLMFIPIANLIMLLVLAFSEWPIERQLRACQRGGTGPLQGGQPHDNFRGM